MSLPLLWLLVMAAPSAVEAAAPDTLVVCPAELRPALVPWEEYRRAQGHVLWVVDSPERAEGVAAAVDRAYQQGRLKYVVLVGDVAADRANAHAGAPPVVPTRFVPARINVRWGSEPTIATDGPYADLDGDRLPDVAVGRIPADSPAELAALVRKVIRYEQQAGAGPWQRQINVVAGVGGFGPLTDTLIEAAARSVFQQTVPDGYSIHATSANSASESYPPDGGLRWLVRQELTGGCLAWVYLGHGLPTELDHVATPTGDEPILSVDDVPRLRCGAASPLAVLVACYTGALDAPSDCLGEQLALAEHGPVAVIAATRVTMPYGNTVLGCELLRSCFAERDPVLGDIWRRAQRQTLADAADDPLRSSLDVLARGLTPLVQGGHDAEGQGQPWQPTDLAAERQEHVWMYQLFGDPLMRLRRPGELRLQAPSDAAAGDALAVDVDTTVGGACVAELVQRGDVLAAVTAQIDAGRSRIALGVPAEAAGRCMVRAFVSGEHGAALGAADVVVRPTNRVSRADADRQVK